MGWWIGPKGKEGFFFGIIWNVHLSSHGGSLKDEEVEGHTLSQEQEGEREDGRHHTEFSRRAKEKVQTAHRCSRERLADGRRLVPKKSQVPDGATEMGQP